MPEDAVCRTLVFELLPHIPFLVLMSSFYTFIVLNTELKVKNNALEKFLQYFAACGEAAQHEYMLRKFHFPCVLFPCISYQE